MTPSDLEALEQFVFSAPEVESREKFEASFAAPSLPRFIRSLVGLDRAAAMERFAHFLDGSRYNSQQIRFVEMIIERLTVQGEVDASALYQPPFTGLHHEGLDGIYGDADADAIVELVQELQRSVA